MLLDLEERLRAHLYVDGVGQGGLRLWGHGGEAAATLAVDDTSDNGFLSLAHRDGTPRARLVVSSAGRGQLFLDSSDDAQRARLYVDPLDQGGLQLRGSGGQSAATVAVDDASDNGFLSLGHRDGTLRARLSVSALGRGDLLLRGSSNAPRAQLQVDPLDHGRLRLRSSQGSIAASLGVGTPTAGAALRLHELSGAPRAQLAVDAAGQGDLALTDTDSVVKAQIGLDDSESSGFVELRGQRGGRIATVEAFAAGMPNDGAVRVFGFDAGQGLLRAELVADPASQGGTLALHDAAGNPTIVLDGASGVIAKAGVNGFLIPHPRNDAQEIFYASLEGPEAGVYTRGTARLRAGRAEVRLPEHFAAVADPRGMTVQLTPNSADTFGLATIEKSPDAIVVRELAGGTGSFTFDFLVQAARSDVPAFEPVRARRSAAAARSGRPIEPTTLPRPVDDMAADDEAALEAEHAATNVGEEEQTLAADLELDVIAAIDRPASDDTDVGLEPEYDQ